MTIHDLAKIGQLILDDGCYDDRQIVPASWLQISTTSKTSNDFCRYGYFWWLSPENDQQQWVQGFGNGGQRLAINHELNTVVVIFAGNYNKPDFWELPNKLLEQFVTPAILQK